MNFSFNLYSTPLLFGFVQAWVFALRFGWRAWRQERLSDALFAALLLCMAFEIWEYMLGFAGVEILWQELEFFPRSFALLLPAVAWVYVCSQFNANFRLTRRHAWHLLPFGVYAAYHLLVFAQGPEFVRYWMETVHNPLNISYVEMASVFVLQGLYFFWSWRRYREYVAWTPTQFSDLEQVSFRWFRNFLWAFFLSGLIGWGMTAIDFWLNLDFWHDWWDELFSAGLIYYLCMEGLAQPQPRRMAFMPEIQVIVPPESSPVVVATPRAEKLTPDDLAAWRTRLTAVMADQKPWLEPELTLPDLARLLQTNPSVLSAAINGAFGVNFNDFVNGYRVEAVKALMQDPAARHLSLLGIALECGFNAKSTFNRAFKKATGVAPSVFNSNNVANKPEA